MTNSPTPSDGWIDGRICPDCDQADHKQIELQTRGTFIDRAGIIWEKWECPNCLYYDWDEVGEWNNNATTGA